MKQVVKVSLDDVRAGEMSTFAVYRNDDWEFPYRLCQIVGRKKIWLDEFDSLTEATEHALAAAMAGYYD